MSYPDRTGFVRRPIIKLTWDLVLGGLLPAINLCVGGQNKGVIYFINGGSISCFVYPRNLFADKKEIQAVIFC